MKAPAPYQTLDRRHYPPPDAPPQATFWPCPCGVLLVERIWHHHTDEEPAHFELCEPPMTAALGLPHRCSGETP